MPGLQTQILGHQGNNFSCLLIVTGDKRVTIVQMGVVPSEARVISRYYCISSGIADRQRS